MSSSGSDTTEYTIERSTTKPNKQAQSPNDNPFAWAIAPSLSQHWTAQSIPIVLTIYSSIDFLKDVLAENYFDGPLVWAAHLFSRTYITNLHRPTALSNESATESAQEIGTYMGKTLSAVATALKDPEGAFRDDIISAVWMLCNYEIIVGSIGRMETESPWHTHAAGLYGMLKTRGNAQFHTQRGRNVFWPTFSLVQLDAILSNNESPPETDEWLENLRAYSEGFMGWHISVFLKKVCHFQARASEIIMKRDTSLATAEYSALFSELTEAENDLGEFASSLDRNAHESDDFMMVMHLASVIKAYNILLLLTNLTTHDPNNPTPFATLYKRRAYCLARVRDAADKVLAATPDLIAELVRNRYNVFEALFQALRLVWPLTAVRLMPSTLPQQKAKAAQGLLIIGRQLGVRQATRSYNMVDNIPIEARVPKKPPMGFLTELEVDHDLCTGYMDGELREPTPEELIGAATPPEISTKDGVEFFMI